MFDSTREILALGLVGSTVVVLAPWITYTVIRRKREKLRRRGIKRHGH